MAIRSILRWQPERGVSPTLAAPADGIHRYPMMHSIPMDALNPDACTFCKLATANGVIGWPGLEGGWHVWMFLPGRHAAAAIPQSRQVFSR